jgi:sigma-B regulation protein RsbU (phosphoserine phosphatase)
VDPEEEGRLYPGEWEPASKRSIRKYLNWDGSGELYDIERTEKYGWMCTTGFPLRDESGEIYAFVLVDVADDNILPSMADYTLKVTAGILIVTLVTAWFASRHIKKAVADPVDRIANAAESYAKIKREGAEQLCFSDLNIQTGDELENLSHVMADMEMSLADHEKQIRKITAEKERINTELQMASRIQESMLPHQFPPFPEIKELDLYASMTPAREVGGDFYDFFLIDENHLAVLIADVSGKGVPAALFMMISKVIIQSCAMLGRGAGEILTKTNEALCSNNQTEMFVTVWLGILEISSGRITAANAGHEYPVLGRNGQFSVLKRQHGLVIGGMEGTEYEEYMIALEPGDKLFIYTDGVTEATDGSDNMFGMDRMLEALNQEPQASPEGTLKNVHAAVNNFVAGAEQFDDLTMLCLEYKGS